jgi:hypothetical protein
MTGEKKNRAGREKKIQQLNHKTREKEKKKHRRRIAIANAAGAASFFTMPQAWGQIRPATRFPGSDS